MKKRIRLLLTLAVVMAATLAINVGSASAQPVCGNLTQGERGLFERTCVEETTRTFTETVNVSRDCEVGNSGRQGTQEGTQTNTFEVTTTTTTKEFFQGNNLNNPQGSQVVSVVESDPVLIEEGEFVATGNCKNNPGPQR